MANKILRLDISKIPDLTPIIYGRVADGLVQTVDVYVTNNGEPFDLTGWVINFEGNTSGNRTYVKDLEGIVMVDRTKGHFTYTFPLIAFSTAGKYERAYFSFVKGDQRESTSDFNIQVFENADITVEEAHTVITEYEELVDELNRIFLEAQTELQQDFDEFKKNYDTKYNNYITDLTNKINAAQNKIDILNSNYEKTNSKLVDLESRMNDLVNNGLLKMEDVLSFLAGKSIDIKFSTDFTGKISGSLVENPNVMKFTSELKTSIHNASTVNAGGELISGDDTTTMWKNYSRVMAVDGKLAQAQQTNNGYVTFHTAAIDVIAMIEKIIPNFFVNVNATTKAQKKARILERATLAKGTAYGYGMTGETPNYSIGRSNWTTSGSTWQGWTGYELDSNTNKTNKVAPVSANFGAVNTAMDNNGIISFLMGTYLPSDGTKQVVVNLDYFKFELEMRLNITDLIPKPDLSKYYTKDEMNEAFTEHSLYSNSLDFGDYDYSGNANLMANINADSFSQGTGALSVIDDGDEVVVTLDPNNKLEIFKAKSQPALVVGKTYIMSVEIMLEDDFTGDPSKISLRYIKMPSWLTALATPYTLTNTKGVWQKLTVTAKMTTAIDNADSWFIFLQNKDVNNSLSGKLRLRHVKIEEGSTATPYQPNLLDEPYYLSKAVWGENLIDPTVKFPITSSVETLYSGRTPEDFVEGETYTVTIGATKPSTQSFGVYLALKNHTIFKPVEGLPNTWTATLKIGILGEKKNAVYIYQSPAPSVGACQIDWLKIEKGDTRTPNLNAPFKYKGIGFTKSSNPKDYNWNSAPENVDFIEENAASNEAKIDEIDKNVVKTSGNQNITGLKNFTGTLQSSGVEVAKKGDSYTKTETDNKFLLKTVQERSLLTIKQSIITVEDWNTITTPGIFYINGGTGANKPLDESASGFLFVKNANIIIITQEFDDGVSKYIRQKGSGGWSPWKKVAFTNEIVNITDNQNIGGVKNFTSIPTINSIPVAQETLGFTCSDGGYDGVDRADGTTLRWGRIVGYDNQYTKDHFSEFFELSEDQKTLTVKQNLRLQFHGNFSSQTANGNYYSYLGIRQNGGSDKRVAGIAGTVNWRNDVGWHTVMDVKADTKLTAVLGTNYAVANANHFGVDFCHISTVLVP